MTTSNHPKSSAWTYAWAFALGFVGFVCGYFGQALLLADQSDAAPLFGIVVTGPIGLFVGVLLGAWSTRLHLSNKQNIAFLLIAVVTGAVVTLYVAVSKYRETIKLIEAEIVSCERVDRLLEIKSKHWSKEAVRVLREGVGNPRPNWEQEIPGMLQARPGAVLSIRIYQEAWVSEQKWRWGSISLRVDNWQSSNENQQVFAAITDLSSHAPCERFVLGERGFFALVWEPSSEYPPNKLAQFLGLFELQQVPRAYVRFIPEPGRLG